MTLVLLLGLASLTAAVAALVVGVGAGAGGTVTAPVDDDVFRFLGLTPSRLEPRVTPMRAAARRVAGVLPAAWVARFSADLDRLGLPAEGDRIVARSLLWASVTAAGSLAVGLPPLVVVLAIATAAVAPVVLLRRAVDTRLEGIRRSLPDALDLLAISVEAGAGFDGAMASAAEDIGGVLGDELGRVLRELRLGVSRRDALVAFKDRVRAPEVCAFVLAVVQADALGSSMGVVLRHQADELRAVRRRRAREQAAKLPVKLLLPLVFGIFPALLVVVLGPAAITIASTLMR